MTIKPSSILLGLFLLFQVWLPAARADTVGNEGDDWAALHAVEKRNTEQTDDALKAKALLDFYRARSKMHPNIGAATLVRVGDLYLNALKQPEEAIKVYDGALNLYGRDASAVLLLEAKSRALLQQNKKAEVVALLRPQLPLLFRASQGGDNYHTQMSSAALRYFVGTDAEARSAQTIALLQQILWQSPVYLEDRAQGAGGWENGWMYERLIDALIQVKRRDEALSWAKRYFQLCAFDNKSIESAAKAMGRAWAATDNFEALRAFLKAQQDAASPNPLRAVPLPTLDEATAEIYKARIVWLNNRLAQGWPDDDGRTSRELINILLAQGDRASLLAAFEVAKNLMKNRPDHPSGAQEMCRLLKAVDLNPIRANALIATDGRPNATPLIALLEELDGGA